MSDWVDDPKIDEQDGWTDDPEPINPLVSGVRKLAQGASAGFLDEFSGGVEAAGRALGYKGAGGSFDDVEKTDDGPTLDWEKLKQSYQEGRDRKRNYLEQDSKDNPGISTVAEIGGSLISPVNKIAPNASMLKQGAAIGGITGLGNSKADNLADAALDTGEGMMLGGALGFGADKAAPFVKKGFNSVSDKVTDLRNTASSGLGKFAEKAAVNATGATGKESAKFADNAGRELLDRGIVKFGDSQSKIASRAGQAVDKANSQIDTALSGLDDAGVNIDTDKLRLQIADKIQELSRDPSKSDIVNHLMKELENLDLATEARSSVELGIKEAEKIKRGFNRKAGNWMDPEKGQAGKEMYQTYRGAVENAASAADPKLAALFEEGKKSHGLLRPIEEAAERRAATTSQSPVGGLLDMATGGAGLAAGGIPAAVAGAVGRRLVAPRISSSVAVTADKVAKMLQSSSPKMAELAQRNPKAFGALVNSVVSKMEAQGGQFPRAAETEQASGGIMDRLAKDPNGMSFVKNDKLKDQIQKLKQGVPEKEAQSQFINEN